MHFYSRAVSSFLLRFFFCRLKLFLAKPISVFHAIFGNRFYSPFSVVFINNCNNDDAQFVDDEYMINVVKTLCHTNDDGNVFSFVPMQPSSTSAFRTSRDSLVPNIVSNSTNVQHEEEISLATFAKPKLLY